MSWSGSIDLRRDLVNIKAMVPEAEFPILSTGLMINLKSPIEMLQKYSKRSTLLLY